MNQLQRDLISVKSKIKDLNADDYARHLLSSIAQDPQTESFDLLASTKTVSQAIMKMADSPLSRDGVCRNVTNLLNEILLPLQSLFCLENLTPIDELIRDRWLFENLTRLKKWCILGKVLAYRNLASFKNKDGSDVVPTPADCPSQIMELWVVADVFENERQPYFRQAYVSKMADSVSFEFLALGFALENNETPMKQAHEFIAKYGTKKRTRISAAGEPELY